MSRVKVQFRTASRGVYNGFCRRYPEVTISYQDWREVVYTYNYMFRDYILETGDRGKLPYGLGAFSISKKKIKKIKDYNGKEYINLPVDWAKTRKAGKRIYNFNAHTDGYRFKWIWFNRDCRFTCSDIWIFQPSRVSSRKITEYLKKPQQSEVYKQWQRK
jgi:hypothetical protein